MTDYKQKCNELFIAKYIECKLALLATCRNRRRFDMIYDTADKFLMSNTSEYESAAYIYWHNRADDILSKLMFSQ